MRPTCAALAALVLIASGAGAFEDKVKDGADVRLCLIVRAVLLRAGCPAVAVLVLVLVLVPARS